MSTSTDKQDAQGRSWDQITKNGTSSAGSMGVGGTGDSGKLDRQGEGQQATRTDDLLTDGSDKDDTGAQGFAGSGQLQTGLEGMGKSGGGAGNRQSGQSEGQSQQDNAGGDQRKR
ncbi:hypothetical protein [Massilia sp. GCM10023247]|uniref:hypothetical protein n=1 Tax=Massilia sp. GCM10023247 TaxID=3252643 RepID=UPI00361B148C